MAIMTVFLGILLLSFNHLSDGFISSKSSGISHVSLKEIVRGFISEKKNGQDRGNILGFERIEPTAGVNTNGQCGVGKSHPNLVDDHHDHRDGWDDHGNDRHDHDNDHRDDRDRWDDHGNDRHDHDDGNGWFGDNDNHHEHDHNRH